MYFRQRPATHRTNARAHARVAVAHRQAGRRGECGCVCVCHTCSRAHWTLICSPTPAPFFQRTFLSLSVCAPLRQDFSLPAKTSTGDEAARHTTRESLRATEASLCRRTRERWAVPPQREAGRDPRPRSSVLTDAVRVCREARTDDVARTRTTTRSVSSRSRRKAKVRACGFFFFFALSPPLECGAAAACHTASLRGGQPAASLPSSSAA